MTTAPFSVFSLTPAAAGYLAQFLLSVLVVSVLGGIARGNERENSGARSLLAVLVTVSLYALAGVLESGFHRDWSLLGVFWKPTIAVLAAVFLIRFVQQLCGEDERVRWDYRVAMVLAVAGLASEARTMTQRLLHLRDGEVVWRTSWEDVVPAGVLFLAAYLCVRRFLLIAGEEARERGWWETLVRPAGARVRTFRFFAMIVLGAGTIATVTGLRLLGGADLATDLVNSFGSLTLIFLFSYNYITTLSGRVSFRTRFQGLLAVTVLGLMTLVSVVGYTAQLVGRSGMIRDGVSPAATGRTLTCDPTVEGLKVSVIDLEWSDV